MVEVTGDTVISAISVKLHSSFSPSPAIYKDQVEQGLVKPCFFVSCIKQTQERIAPNWFKRSASMEVRFHPTEGTNKYAQCRAIGEKLLEVLDSVDLPCTLINYSTLPCWGRNLEYKIRDEVLIFYVTYDFKVKKVVTAETAMAELELIL